MSYDIRFRYLLAFLSYHYKYFSAYDCIPGEFSESGKEPCDKCEEGHYSVMGGSTECFECPEGLVAPKRGSDQCFTNETGKQHGVTIKQ